MRERARERGVTCKRHLQTGQLVLSAPCALLHLGQRFLALLQRLQRRLRLEATHDVGGIREGERGEGGGARGSEAGERRAWRFCSFMAVSCWSTMAASASRSFASASLAPLSWAMSAVAAARLLSAVCRPSDAT